MNDVSPSIKARTRRTLVSLLRQRSAASLLVSQLGSRLGDGALFVALTLYVLATYRSAALLAGVAAARLIPYGVFVLFGGAVVDRFSRRRVLLFSHLTRAVLTLALFVVALVSHVHYVEIVIYAACFGLGDCLFDPALNALIPEIIEPAALPAMNSALPLVSNGAGSIAGPALGGVLLAWSFDATLLVTGVFFVIGVVAVLCTPRPGQSTHTSTHSILRDIASGVSYVRATSWLSYSIVAYTFLNSLVFAPIPVLVPFFLRTALHASNAVVDASFVVEGVAGVVAALVAVRLPAARRRVRVMWIWWGSSALLAGLVAVATNQYEVVLFAGVSFIPFLVGNVLWNTVTQIEVPSDLRGRVTSIDYLFAYGLSPLGLLLATLLADAIGVRTYFLLAGVMAVGAALAVIASKKANAIDTTPQPVPLESSEVSATALT